MFVKDCIVTPPSVMNPDPPPCPHHVISLANASLPLRAVGCKFAGPGSPGGDWDGGDKEYRVLSVHGVAVGTAYHRGGSLRIRNPVNLGLTSPRWAWRVVSTERNPKSQGYLSLET